MKTRNRFTPERMKSEIFGQLQNESLNLNEMLQIKGGGGGDEDPPPGNDQQEDGYN